MNRMTFFRGVTTAIALSLLTKFTAFSADHRDGPIFGPPGITLGALDLNDLFIFQSPTNPNNTVLILTMSPFAGVMTPDTFDSQLRFDIKVDQNLDQVPDLTFRTTFGRPDETGGQTVRLVALRPGRRAETMASGNTRTNILIEGGGQFRAGIHDDPFFFDAVGFAMLADDGAGTFPRAAGAAANFFGPNVNTLAIIIEIPTANLVRSEDRPVIRAWGTTLNREGKQVDRNGLPFVNQFTIPPLPLNDAERDDRRNAFNRGTPARDTSRFRSDMIGTLTGFWDNSPARAGALVDRFLVPAVITFDSSFTFQPAGFPNGRRLRDDVAYYMLNLVSNGQITTDGVADDNGTRITDGQGSLAAFPYIGAPHTIQ